MLKTIKIVVIILGIALFFYMNKDNGDMKNSEMLAGEGMSVISEEINYFEDIEGFYAHPETSGTYPGVVMIHEWWGLNDNIKDMARQLAKEDYYVLAVDLFGKVATTPDEARAQIESLDQIKALENLKSATNFLKEKGAPKVASLGWCFGGGQSLQLSVSGEDLSATVIYYGQLVTDKEKLGQIKWPVLGIFGEEDTSIPVTQVDAFRDSLTSLGIENSINKYPGVGHAFANPSGANYAPEETKDAWVKTLAFLKENLKN
jgi:carboxymethylenebutenolidase